MAGGMVCLHLLVPGTEFQCDSEMLCLETLSHGQGFFNVCHDAKFHS